MTVIDLWISWQQEVSWPDE